MEADEIDPQARRALERRERFSMPHSRFGLKLLRRVIDVATWVENRRLPSVETVVDRTIPGPGGDLPVRLYRPAVDEPRPTVVFFHGGGYVLGGFGTHEWLCRHLARETGCGVLAVDYRLAPEHPFPAAVEDAYAAVQWAAANPEAIGGDGRLAVAGDSAGGALAAVTALRAAESDGPEIDYQVLVYPGVGVDEEQASVRDHAGLVLSKADLAFIRECYYESRVHERNPYADPTNAGDVAGVAPATVLTAGFDPLRDGGKTYAEELVRDGVRTRYRNYESMVHGFMTYRTVDRARDAIVDVAGDLRDAFADVDADVVAGTDAE